MGLLAGLFGRLLGTEPGRDLRDGRVTSDDGFVDVDLPIAQVTRAYDRPPLRGMVDRLAVGLIGLQGDPRDVLRVPIRMKAFLHPDGPDELYAEVFLNVDVPAGLFQLHDKDPGYHGTLLASLTVDAPSASEGS
jgi:hypothetical protein